ncbi:MAG TPA: porphobilinogen synthase, partial [Planctomycetaceae bacterium]|nr:porphobilinogen synthase [Planctomycetaceae bacterium]
MNDETRRAAWTGGQGEFPQVRMRRLRQHPAMRDLVRETRLSAHDLILPLFVRYGRGKRVPISSMPGQWQLSVDVLAEEVREAAELGLRAALLFGIPERKDAIGSAAWDDNGVVQQALRALRDAVGDRLLLMADLCFCEYTDHGHCGVLSDRTGRRDVENDATLENLCRQAVSLARAGA